MKGLREEMKWRENGKDHPKISVTEKITQSQISGAGGDAITLVYIGRLATPGLLWSQSDQGLLSRKIDNDDVDNQSREEIYRPPGLNPTETAAN